MTQPTIVEVAGAIARAQGGELAPRWSATLKAFYGLPLADADVAALVASTRRSETNVRTLSGTGRPLLELWARVGRRGLKSTTAALIALYEAAFGEHEKFLLPGEKGIVAAISKDSAGSELVTRFVELHAQALGLKCRWSSTGALRMLDIEGLRFRIACFPCNTSAPRGYPIATIVADEIAMWSSDTLGANPDVEVLAAIKPAMAQFRTPKLVAISSPFGVIGSHYQTVEENLTDAARPDVLAVQGPTWLWNTAIDEEKTHSLERDPVRHAREYGAVPAETEQSAFDLADVEAAFALRAVGRERSSRSFVLTDASSLRGDAFAFAFGGELDDGAIEIKEIDAFEGARLKSLDMGDVVAEISARARLRGSRKVFGDQREAASLQVLFKREGLLFKDYAWSSRSKDSAVQLLRRMMCERKLILPPHDELRREMVELQARLQPSGQISYETNGKDYVALLLVLAHAIEAGALRTAVLPNAIAQQVENWRKIAANPQRAANRMSMLMGHGPQTLHVDRSTQFCHVCGYNPGMCRC